VLEAGERMERCSRLLTGLPGSNITPTSWGFTSTVGNCEASSTIVINGVTAWVCRLLNSIIGVGLKSGKLSTLENLGWLNIF